MWLIASLTNGSLTRTITWPELLWLVLGLVGFGFALTNLIEATRDLEALNMAGRNGRLRIVAFANVREEALRVLKCLSICGIGIAAMVSPPSNAANPVSALSLIVTMGLFFISLLVVVGSVSARRTRLRTLAASRHMKIARESALLPDEGGAG